LLSAWEYSEKMKIRSNIMKVVFAVLVFSLVVPFSPSVSSAKAKICCKKNCRSMMGTAATSKTASHGKSAAPCVNKSCLITDKKFESLSVVVAHDKPQLSFSLVDSLVKESPQGFQFIPAKGAAPKQQSLPLYLSNSILRI
jgi:hypothetical protein